MPGKGGLVDASAFAMSENERAVEEWKETQKNRPGRSSEHVAMRNIHTLTRMGAPVTTDERQNWWQIFLLTQGPRPLALECDNCSFMEWTERVVAEDNRSDGGGYVVQDFLRVVVRNGAYVTETQPKRVTWCSMDVGELRMYFCEVGCRMAWERARPKLNRLHRDMKPREFVLSDGQRVTVKSKATA